MERLETEGRWTMFDPDDVPLLQASYGQSLTYAYEQYENHVTPIAVLPAEDVWQALCEAQRNTGYPTCVFSCTVNRKHAYSEHTKLLNLINLQVKACKPT